MAAVLSGGSGGLLPCCCCGSATPVQGRDATCTDWLMASRHLRCDLTAISAVEQPHELPATSSTRNRRARVEGEEVICIHWKLSLPRTAALPAAGGARRRPPAAPAPRPAARPCPGSPPAPNCAAPPPDPEASVCCVSVWLSAYTCGQEGRLNVRCPRVIVTNLTQWPAERVMGSLATMTTRLPRSP